MQSTTTTSTGFRRTNRRGYSISSFFEKKRDEPPPVPGSQPTNTAVDVIEPSPDLSSPTFKEPVERNLDQEASQGRIQLPDTPPTSPRNSSSHSQDAKLTSPTRQRFERPQTPMDFTFQPFQPTSSGLGNSRVSIANVQSQLEVVREELEDMQRQLAEKDERIRCAREELDSLMAIYQQAILHTEKSSLEKDELLEQVQRLKSAWTAERELRQASEEEIQLRMDKERQLQARVRRMAAQGSLTGAARARRPIGEGEQMMRAGLGRRATAASVARGSYPFNQSSVRGLEL